MNAVPPAPLHDRKEMGAGRDMPSDRVGGTAWLILFTLALFYVLSFIDRQILAMMVDPIKRDLGIGDFKMSLLLGLAFATLYTFFGLLMGGIVDRYPRRMVVYLGVILWSLATAFCGLATSYGHLFLGRMLVGIGEATLTPAAYSILSDVFPRRRLSLAIALFTLGSSLGMALTLGGGGLVIAALAKSGAIVLPLVGAVSPWQVTFIGLGLAGLLFAHLIFLGPEPQRRMASPLDIAGTPNWRQTFAWIAERRQLWLGVLMTYVPMGILATVAGVWTPAYMARNFGWSPADLGMALALSFAIPHALGQAFNGFMVDRLFARGVTDAHFRYFLVIAIISSIAGIAAYLVHSATLFLMLLPILSFLLLAGGGFGAAGLQMLTPNRLRGRIGGFYMVLITLPSFVVGPSLIAWIAGSVFASEKALGQAIAVTMIALLPVMVIGSFVGMRAMRELVPKMEAGQ